MAADSAAVLARYFEVAVLHTQLVHQHVSCNGRLPPSVGDRGVYTAMLGRQPACGRPYAMAHQRNSCFELRPRRAPTGLHRAESSFRQTCEGASMMCAITLRYPVMHVRASHSALDELLDLPSALEGHLDQAFQDFADKQPLDISEPRAGSSTNAAREAAALWLPAPGSDFKLSSSTDSQRPCASGLARLTSNIVWVGEASGMEVCCAATGGAEDQSQCCATAPPTVTAAQGRKSKAAWRPCYQTVLKVCCAGNGSANVLICLPWHLHSRSYYREDCNALLHVMGITPGHASPVVKEGVIMYGLHPVILRMTGIQGSFCGRRTKLQRSRLGQRTCRHAWTPCGGPMPLLQQCNDRLVCLQPPAKSAQVRQAVRRRIDASVLG